MEEFFLAITFGEPGPVIFRGFPTRDAAFAAVIAMTRAHLVADDEPVAVTTPLRWPGGCSFYLPANRLVTRSFASPRSRSDTSIKPAT